MAARWSIYPADRSLKALCKVIDDYADEVLAKILKNYLVELNQPLEQRNEEAVAKYRALVAEQLANLDNLLERKDYLVAGQYTLADISVYSFLRTLDLKAGPELICGYKNLSQWYNRIKAR